MPRIVIQGRAAVFRNDARVSDAELLASLIPLTYNDEVFTDYLGGTELEDALLDALDRSGVLQFGHESGSEVLTATVEYRAKRPLSKSELATLVDYTMGQWSDGIGENWMCESSARTGYAIKCLTPGDTLLPSPYPVIEAKTD